MAEEDEPDPDLRPWVGRLPSQDKSSSLIGCTKQMVQPAGHLVMVNFVRLVIQDLGGWNRQGTALEARTQLVGRGCRR
jgi:hypothetical protein